MYIKIKKLYNDNYQLSILITVTITSSIAI